MMQAKNPPFITGDEWWQQLISYGISRKVDAQYLEAYQNNSTDQPAMDAQGNVYYKGQPAYLAASGNVIGGKNYLPLILVGLASVVVLAFALKR